MFNPRLPVAAVAGLLFSSAVFMALSRLVSVPFDGRDPIKSTVIEFTAQRVDTPVESKRDRKVPRPPPQILPARNNTTVTRETGDGDTPGFLRAKLDLPIVDRNAKTPGIDRDVIPIVRGAPEYPPRAQTRGIEGWVQIQFTVTPTGTVRDPVVVAAEPKGEFEDAALKAIARWRYHPRIDGGAAVERVGLQTVIRFELGK